MISNLVHHKDEKRFQQNLRNIVTKYIILLAVICTALFVVGQFVVVLISNQTNAMRHLDHLEQSFLFFDNQSRDFLNDESTVEVAKTLIQEEDEESIDRIKNAFWKFQEKCGIGSEIILVNYKGDVIYTSFGERLLSSYLTNYNNAICYNAKNTGTDEIYRAVYYEQGNYADVMYVKPVYDNGEITGYISVFLSGSSWNFYLSEANFDGVITDVRNNAMYVSKPGLLSSSNKFFCEPNGSWKNGTERYWVVSKYLPEKSAIIYSLVYYPQNDGIWVGIAILLIISLAWYIIAMWISRTMAKKNASSIETLVSEIHVVKEHPDYRIQMNTGDEFAEVGYQINALMDHIMVLNERNEELSALSARIELAQLTAQINPHFLYNTLETIRNLVTFDATKAEELIIDLTDILRYSVDSTRQEVLLMEDMEYLYRYLNIQGCRFGDRLHWQVDLSPECNGFHVPKLLIQPIVENSIKYGFQKKMDLHINITGYVESHVLRICVSDDGLGMDEEEARTLERQLAEFDNQSRSIGLRNLSRRLYLRYGKKSGLRIHNKPGCGFEVYISVECSEGV